MSAIRFAVLAFMLCVTVESFSFADEPRVQDIPLPKDASDATYVRRRGDIRFNVTSDMKTAGNFYATTLNEQKWMKAKNDNLQRNFWVQSFQG
jgi:hypothetical protein